MILLDTMLSHQQWNQANKRRIELIDKQFEAGLNDEENRELQLLQETADRQVALLDAKMHEDLTGMLVTVKSREIQRGMMAAMGGQPDDARRHFLAAAHLELVLAGDYENSGDAELSRRSRISAASCFWRAGETGEAQTIFDELTQVDPSRASEVQEVIDDLRTI